MVCLRRPEQGLRSQPKPRGANTGLEKNLSKGTELPCGMPGGDCNRGKTQKPKQGIWMGSVQHHRGCERCSGKLATALKLITLNAELIEAACQEQISVLLTHVLSN